MRKMLRSKNAQTTKIRDGGNSIKEVAGPGSGRTEGGDKKVFKPCGLECKSHCRLSWPTRCAPETLNQFWNEAIFDMY